MTVKTGTTRKTYLRNPRRSLLSVGWGALIVLGSSLALAVQTRAADCTPLPPGGVAWWPGDGNALDYAGTNNGTRMNGAAFAPSQVAQAFIFDGIDDYVEVPDSPSLRITNTVSIEFWAKRQRIWSDFVVEKGGDWNVGEPNYAVSFTEAYDGGLLFLFRGGWRFTSFGFDLDWHHYAVVASDGAANPTFYVDGAERPVEHSTGLGTINLYPSTRPLHIGSLVGDPRRPPIYGQNLIDELAIYSRALSSDEVAAIYAAGAAGKCTLRIVGQPQSQVGYWGMSVAFNVTARGDDPLSYQWCKDGEPLTGATATSLSLTNLQMTNAGSYTVVVADFSGSVTSNPAMLTVNPAGVAIALYAGVTIDGVVGYTYGIQSTTDLSNTNSWAGVTNITLTVPTQLWYDSQPAHDPARYYRVVPGPISIP